MRSLSRFVSRGLAHAVICCAVLSSLSAPSPAAAQTRSRETIPDKYKADLTHLYPTLDAWRAAKASVEAAIPKLGEFKGRLASASVLADALEYRAETSKVFARASTYAGLLADQDTRVSEHQAREQEMVRVGALFGAAASYMEPEILRIPRDRLAEFVKAEPRLAAHRLYLTRLARMADHTLGDSEERLLAEMRPFSGASSDTYTILANADLPYPDVTLSDGRTVNVDMSAYNALRALPDRTDRQKVMSSFFEALGRFSRTFGTTMNGELQRRWFLAKARKYPSAVEASLAYPNIPVSVYTGIVDGVTRALPTFHRYLSLRKRMMGVDELHYYDLYAPLVASVDLRYTPEEAQAQVLAAVAPLGAEYVSVVERAFRERWIDLLPNEGKVTGATSRGVYDVHPYIMMNFYGAYADVATLAHELGHTMHSHLASRAQPYVTAGAPIFVAEVASTVNEMLLNDYMLRRIEDRDTRLSVLGNYLEAIKGSVFRQSQFADFELQMHQMVERGESITGDALAKLYLDITRKTYGHDLGVAVVDDYIAHEWSFVPHFYSSFYVFQYATSFAASATIFQKLKTGGPEAATRYLAFLSAGGSVDPVDLLKEAGVDMTTSEPLDLTIREMNRVMDEMEKLLE